jgi:TonB family protein
MNCQRFNKRVSLYLDDQLGHREQTEFLAHLNQCAYCREHLAQMRAIWQEMRRLPRPAVAAGLVQQTLAAFDAHQRTRPMDIGGRFRQLANWAVIHPRTVSAVASIVITLAFYTAILDQLKPLTNLALVAHTEPVLLSPSAYHRLNGSSEPLSESPSFTFPRVEAASELVNSLGQTRRGHLVVLALVHTDGRVSLVEVVEPSGSPEVEEQANVALRRMWFRPAMLAGRPVATQLVLMLHSVEVGG